MQELRFIPPDERQCLREAFLLFLVSTWILGVRRLYAALLRVRQGPFHTPIKKAHVRFISVCAMAVSRKTEPYIQNIRDGVKNKKKTKYLENISQHHLGLKQKSSRLRG